MLPERFTNPHTKFKFFNGKNVLPTEVLEHPDYKPFFDVIAIIMAEIKKQGSMETKIVTLPKSLNMKAVSNYGITAQLWFDHNFGAEYEIEIEYAA